jgi:peptide/nickel transport system substrate-binding protein
MKGPETTMMHRRTLLRGAAAAATFPLARPAFSQSGAARTLRYIPQSDLTVLDPVVTTAYITRHHALMVWDQLYGVDAQLRPQPQMVEGHTVEQDGKLWTFTLREGLEFHDGEPVRGRDCVASIKRWAQRDPLGQALMTRVAEMAAPSGRSFTIRLHRPFGAMLDALAKVGPPALVIMPERLATTDPARQVTEIIGSGPFRFKADERVVGARVVYEKFARYRPRQDGEVEWAAGPKLVHFDRVEWTVMPDSGTATAAMQSGEADWWENPPNDLLPPLRRDRNITLVKLSPLGTTGTGIFNHRHPPFDNPGIRRAVLMAASQEDFMTATAGTDSSLWHVPMGVFTPGSPMASDVGLDALRGPRDMAAAKRALQAAGYKGERTVLLAPSDQPALVALAEVGHDLLQKLGMNVDYQVSDWGTLVQRRASTEPVEKGGWSMFHTTWNGIDMVNPIGTQVLRANGARAFFGWPDVPKLEALREQWLDAPNVTEQQHLAGEIQRVALEEAVFLPTGQYFGLSAHRKDIADLVSGVIVFWNVRRV